MNRTVVHYLEAIKSLAAPHHGTRDGTYEKASDNAPLVRDLLDARVFDIDIDTWAAITAATTEQVREIIEEQQGQGPPLDLLEGWSDVPFPFSHCYFGCGDGYIDEHFEHRIQERGIQRMFPGVAQFIGILATREGNAAEVYRYVETGATHAAYLWLELTDKGEWVGGQSIGPVLWLNLVRFINEFQTFVVEEEEDRHSWRRKLKGFAKMKRKGYPTPVPKPFYSITLKDARITPREAAEQTLRKRGTLAYRHDVRSHERVLVRRGTLPQKEATKRQLGDRGYKIYTHGAVPSGMLDRLARRALQPPRMGEWIALKITHVAAHVRGPKDAPYVPATRRATI
jgi:hypothetical protein